MKMQLLTRKLKAPDKQQYSKHSLPVIFLMLLLMSVSIGMAQSSWLALFRVKSIGIKVEINNDRVLIGFPVQ